MFAGGNMKVSMDCYICLLERAIKFSQMINADPETSLRIAKEVSKLLIEEFDFDANPAILGTKREKLIARLLGTHDPYKELKEKSNKVGLEVAKRIFSSIDMEDTSYDTFRKVIIYAAAANAMEWFIRGHDFSLEKFDAELSKALNNIAIDDTPELYNLIKDSVVLYSLDNAGEASVDLYVVKYLRGVAKRIIVTAKSEPVLNDITVEEASELGFEKVADELVGSGEYVGLHPNYISEELKGILKRVDLIIAKGMGAYETLTDIRIDKPTFVLLKAKCTPVARSLGVPQGKLVVKRLY